MKRIKEKKGESSQLISTIIEDGVEINGNINSSDSIMINGTINGDCNFSNKAFIGSSGYIKGDISADYIRIEGDVNGDIDANTIEIVSGGRIHGNIITDTLIIDEGGKFNGNCEMTGGTHDENYEIMDLDDNTELD